MDTVLLMQRLEAERRARLQDEERRRQQQLEEMRTREAEERARQEEQRRRQEDERVRREAEDKRRQEDGYYSRLEAERRRQHEEAERRLLEPEEPGLGRPPLPRGYEPAGPPPPPQRTASYLQTQAFSPDALYTAKFVAYNEEEDEDDEPAGQDRPSGQRARPVSDGIFLAGPFRPPPPGASRTGPRASPPLPPPSKPGPARPGHSRGTNSYAGPAGTGFGAHDVYRDPRERPPKSQEADVPGGPGAPENLTFRERQRLFSQGHDVSNKVKASRKLTELENELNTK